MNSKISNQQSRYTYSKINFYINLQIFDIIIILKFMHSVNFYNQKVLMQHEAKTKKNLKIEKEFQVLSSGCQSFAMTSENQSIQNKVDLQLYLHFLRMFENQNWHYFKQSQFFEKSVSKQKIVNETIKFQNYLKQNIKPLPHQHNQQLLFLINYFNNNNQLITNQYRIDSYCNDSTGPAQFQLYFNLMKQRIDLKKFVSFNNWNHLLALSFDGCGWFNDNDWNTISGHGNNFKNLRDLSLFKNQIREIKEGDIEHFKSLKWIQLSKLLIKKIEDNPLRKESLEVLKRLKQRNNQLIICLV